MADTPENMDDPNADDAPLVDGIGLLKSDHRKVEDLFVQYEAAADGAARKALAQQICLELKIHTMIEEEIFYPAVREAAGDDKIAEALVEHDGAKVLVNDIEAGDPDADDYYDAKVKVLSEEIKHHVQEEEMPDTGLFAKARAGGLDLVALGAVMKARKEELVAAGREAGLPPAKPAVVNLIAA